MKKYVYIAGPYSEGDVALNVKRAIETADTMSVFNIIPFVPHLSHFWHMIRAHEIDYWYKYDLAWLEKCDCLFRLDGDSPGADNEVKRAEELGIPVFFSQVECEEWAERTGDDTRD